MLAILTPARSQPSASHTPDEKAPEWSLSIEPCFALVVVRRWLNPQIFAEYVVQDERRNYQTLLRILKREVAARRVANSF